MDNRASNGVKARTTVGFGSADTKQAKFTHASKQFRVEALVAVVFKRLRFNMLCGPFPDHLSEHQMFFAWVGDVHVGHATPSPRWLLTFGARLKS